MIESVKYLVAERAKAISLNGQQCFSFFISISNGKQRAFAHHVRAKTFDEAWGQLEEYWSNWVEAHGKSGSWLRVDWTQSAQKISLKQLKLWLEKVKRNYFRYGLIVDDTAQYAFTEQELNANAMLYGGVNFPHVVVNENNFSIYAKRKYKDFSFEFNDSDVVWMLGNAGVFISEKEGPFLLHPKGRDAGRRIINKLDSNDVFGLIETSSQYLAAQVQKTGEFYYGWHPCFDREINFYNTLRHASTTYSMIEAYELSQSVELEEAIDRSLSYLIHHFIKLKKISSKNNENEEELTAAFLVEYKEKEIKLGANGVLMLALCKYTEVFSDNKYLELLEQMALGISFMQNQETGEFNHVLNYPDFSVKDTFRIIYYDGEAAFGLMRLYGITKDERWLAIVEKAFDYFIAAEHWKAHDHWLSYCVNELTLHKPDEKYYRFGIQNVAGYLDFVATRITTFPTLLELMMAAERMVCRLQESKEYGHLLDELDIEAFYEALEKRAHYLLNGYFWPEIAMYFANPERIVGSFFIRHHSFRVRIDDVEHYLSGFVAYWKYLGRKGVLSKDVLPRAVNGKWIAEPTDHWVATGVCIHLSVFKVGHVLIARGKRHNGYLSDVVIKQLVEKQASAIICVDPTPYLDFGVPILQVSDVRAAILALGKEARNRFIGETVGITGSAGKTTTVAMMAHALSQFGITGATQKSANLPIGIAWNQVNMPKYADRWVVEMAVGSMAINSKLVMPQVAIVTNIAPAHLVYHKNTQTIAEKKSLIMDAMTANGTLVIFGEILHKNIFLSKANAKNISVITYGESESNNIQLLEVNKSRVKVRFWDDIYEFDIGLVSKHMILNALSVFASLFALKLDWKKSLEIYQKFQSLEGRGKVTSLELNEKFITIYDESYNANPISMKASIESIANIKKPKNNFLILGDMMELGPDEVFYHKELKKEILNSKPDKLILCGSLMKNLWDDIKYNDDFSFVKKEWYPSVKEVVDNINYWLEDKDHIMLKASNSMGFNKVVEYIKKLSLPQ